MIVAWVSIKCQYDTSGHACMPHMTKENKFRVRVMIHRALLVNMQRGDGDHARGFLGKSPLRAARGWGPCQGLPGVVTAAVSSHSATNREHCPNLIIALWLAVALHWVAPLYKSYTACVVIGNMMSHGVALGDLGHPSSPLRISC